MREADGVPFWGGAYIKGTRFPNESYGSRCSSGFRAHSSSNNSDYLLIPWHCLNEDDARVWNGGDTYMGKVLSNNWDPQYDVAYLKVPSANTIYAGAHNGRGSYFTVSAARRRCGPCCFSTKLTSA